MSFAYLFQHLANPPYQTAKSPKPNRRLSARFTGFLKNVTKKDQVTKDEPAKEASTETPAVVSTESTEVAEQAPKIAEPTPTEPLSIVEVSKPDI